MQKNTKVTDPTEVKEIFMAMKEEYFSIMGVDKSNEKDHPFKVHLIPAYLPLHGPYEVINNFNLILEGAYALRNQDSNTKLIVSIIELVVQESSTKSHSYIITPLNFDGIGNGYYA